MFCSVIIISAQHGIRLCVLLFNVQSGLQLFIQENDISYLGMA